MQIYRLGVLPVRSLLFAMCELNLFTARNTREKARLFRRFLNKKQKDLFYRKKEVRCYTKNDFNKVIEKIERGEEFLYADL